MNKFQKNLVLGTITSGAIVTLVIVIAFIIHSSLILRNNRRKIQSSNADNLTNTDDIDKERNVTVRTTMVDFDLAVRIARINTKYIGSTLISYTWVPDETMRPISSLGGNINSKYIFSFLFNVYFYTRNRDVIVLFQVIWIGLKEEY